MHGGPQDFEDCTLRCHKTYKAASCDALRAALACSCMMPRRIRGFVACRTRLRASTAVRMEVPRRPDARLCA
eukprot:364233-Chlamydomonas_euryale.AAC.17